MTKGEDHLVTAAHRKAGVNSGPVLILAISNGAGHIRTAQGIAAALHEKQPELPVTVIDVAEYMTRLARFTHVSAYMWVVKNAPAAWDRIDRYQKKQSQTSPGWYYRRGCRRLFRYARQVRPRALIATEVGCCEVASLVKRDLGLDLPLIAVNVDFDADRAWVQPEVDLYCFVAENLGEELIANGAPRERVVTWGATLPAGYDAPRERETARREVCRWLRLDPQKPLVLVAGGGEGMGRMEEIAVRLLSLEHSALQLVVLTGRNERLKRRCERLLHSGGNRLRVLGWTGPEQMPKLMYAADLMASKLGGMFNEAIASELPIIALKPPPGSERVQHGLLEEWGIGCAVRTVDEVVDRMTRLLAQPSELQRMRENARAHHKSGVSGRIAEWLVQTLDGQEQRKAVRHPICEASESAAV
jgi:processive 1,2-diacylglycerol beta-glucosyltransferase